MEKAKTRAIILFARDAKINCVGEASRIFGAMDAGERNHYLALAIKELRLSGGGAQGDKEG